MQSEYDFRNGKRGAIDPIPDGKTRVTLAIDDDILDWFRDRAHQAGGGNYQTLINTALRQHIDAETESLETTLRRVIREELHR